MNLSIAKLSLYHRGTPAANKRLLYTVPCLAMLVWSTGLFAAAPRVAVSVSPVHSLVSAVMQGAAIPELLISPGHSPHTQALSPSAVKTVYDADLVIRVGPDLEKALSKIAEQVKPQDRVKSLLDDAGLHILPFREQGVWADLEHDEHEEHGHDEHDEHEEHGHEGHAHAEGDPDPHVWLSTENAILIVSAFAEWISRIDSGNKALYQRNRDQVIARIHQTGERVSQILEPVKTIPYIVFHDAWQYYEKENQLNSLTSVSSSTDHAPAIRQVRDVRRLIRERGVQCIFREPQFDPGIIQTVIKGTQARTGTLDPLGAELAPGPDMWHELMLSIARSLKTCLSGE